MRQLIRLPGLRLVLFELQGSLTYSQTRNGEKSEPRTIRDCDIEDETNSDDDSTGGLATIKSGIDASAVGIHLRLTKNDGLLKLHFEGHEGSCADWVFEGLPINGGQRMVASALTQTDTDPKQCPVCGKDKSAVLEVMDQKTKTDSVPTLSTDHQMKTGTATCDIGIQTTPISGRSSRKQAQLVVGPLVAESPTNNVQRNVIEELRSKSMSSDGIKNVSTGYTKSILNHSPSLESESASAWRKRRAASPPPGGLPILKNAKSMHDSVPRHRHIYMTCYRTTPRYGGDEGVLHIDLEDGTVWFEGWHGRPNGRTFERKQLFLLHHGGKYRSGPRICNVLNDQTLQ